MILISNIICSFSDSYWKTDPYAFYYNIKVKFKGKTSLKIYVIKYICLSSFL